MNYYNNETRILLKGDPPLIEYPIIIDVKDRNFENDEVISIKDIPIELREWLISDYRL